MLLRQRFPVVAMEQEAFTKWKEHEARHRGAGGGPGPLLPASPSSQPCAWGAWESGGPRSAGPQQPQLGRVPARRGRLAPLPLALCCSHQLGAGRGGGGELCLASGCPVAQARGGVPAGEAPGSLHRLRKQEIHKRLRSPFWEQSRTGHSSPFTHCSANPKYHPHDGTAAMATLPWGTHLVPLRDRSRRCEDVVEGLHRLGWGCVAGRSQHQTGH